jgi:L-2-hydroxyglutarate oxidase LhgO
MHTAHTVIVGAGIMGLTLARELLSRGEQDILILDKEPAPGAHASGRNSGVLHAGVYYAAGSAKARTCLAGNRLMRAYCQEHGLPLVESGKVIVATTPAELRGLFELKAKAEAAGAEVRLIDEQELAEIEPNAATLGKALYSPLTAVVDPKAILGQLAKDIVGSGKARILYNAPVEGVDGPDGLLTPLGRVEYRRLVNAAGAHADKLAHAFGQGLDYVLVPFKGCYRRLKQDRSHLVGMAIYPVPDPRMPFLGVHFTKSVAGAVYIGPTATPALGRENYGILSGLDREAPEILLRDAVLFVRNPAFRATALAELRKYFPAALYSDARRLVKHLEPGDIEPSPKVGIRPQLVNRTSHQLVMDFLVERDDRRLHVLNSISPAFTASMAMAKLLCDEHLPKA